MKNIIVLLICFVILASICSCSPSQNGMGDNASKATVIPTETAAATKNTETVIPFGQRPDLTGYTELSKYEDENLKVWLYAEVERDSGGELFWNDGQRWLLVAETGGKSYTLVDKYVQLGNIYFEVAEYYQNREAIRNINAIITTGASFELINYIYDDSKNGYVASKQYSSDDHSDSGINKIFSSIPEIK